MTVPDYGGCLWPVDTACLTDQWLSLSPQVRDRALALASSTLERLTGYRVGNCPVSIRPCQGTICARPASSVYSEGYFLPVNWSGTWFNCLCGNACQCGAACEVQLPGPVGRIDQVRVDGVVVPPNQYRVDNGNILVYTGSGDCKWPRTQDLSKPPTATGTFEVTYLNAYPVDSLGAYAVGILAMEFASACEGNACRLPNGVTMVVRQGITMEIASGAFPNGLTGINEVDTYIALWNPNALQRQASVYVPGCSTARITTGGTA